MKTANLIEGLQILRQYNRHDYYVDAQHDEITAVTDRPVSEEHRKQLLALEWRFDHESELWGAFV